MRYVIFRDDDTNPFTPPESLERLYRPFLERGWPVNLATIPCVRTDLQQANGEREGFLPPTPAGDTAPIASNAELIAYLRSNSGYRIVQHGYHHDLYEFERHPRAELARRLEHGTELLREAGFNAPRAFVAPYDRISREGYAELAARFSVISASWFELGRLPLAWWPRYAAKKFTLRRHWQVGPARLLSHPGCLLSCHRPKIGMLDQVRRIVASQQVTVLVTHWWEYFRHGAADEAFIDKLHETGDYLATQRDVQIIAFDDLISGKVPLH